MANYAVTKEAIENVIKANGNNEITGQLLQNVLIAMIDALGADCQFVGVATPETNPGTPDQNVAYLAGPGTYPNFGPTTVEVWQIGIFKYDGVWNYTVIDTNLGDNCININQIAKHATAYSSFGDAIADVPEKFRKPGCIVVYKDAEMYGEWIAAIFDDYVEMWENEASWRSFGPVNADFDYETQDYVVYVGRELIMRVIDNLVSTSRGASLSANQGRILNEKIVGYDNIVAEITTTPVNLSHVILEGDIITSFGDGVTKLIFGRGSAYQDTINATDLPYKVTHNYFDVATESGTLHNVTIHVRGDIFHSFLNVNVFNGQTAAYGSAALARAAVPVTERFVGLQITYLLADGWFTDQYIGSDISGWGTASNWIELGPVSFEKNPTTGHIDIKIGSQILSIPSIEENEELTKNIQSNTDNILTTLQQIVDQKNLIPIEVTDIINDNYIADGEVGTVPELVSSITFSIKKFSITGGKPYAFSSMRTSSTALPFVLTWIDANGKIVLQEYKGNTEESIYWTDKAIFAPSNATELWMTCRNISSAIFNQSKLKDITDDLKIKSEVEQNTNEVEAIKNSMTKSDYTILEPSSTIANSYVKAGTAGSTPELMQVNNMSVRKYAVIGGNNYAFNSVRSRLDTTYIITWLNADGKIISQEYVVTGSSGDTFWNKEQVVAPINAVEMWMNVESTTPSRIAYSEFMSVSKELVDVVKLEDTVQTIQEEIGYKITPMKVVVNALEGEPESVPFYIRAKYDDEKDIIITHRINSNGILSFKETYIGPNVLNDADLINNNFLISSHTDSTGPLGGGSYWALFAQHGYAIPVINNSVGMSVNDVGAEWKDQLNRHFIIGKVTGSNIFLLPVIYQDAHGHYIRDWRSTTLSDDITTLIHVSGGVYTSTFNVAATNQVQLYPIMQHNNRKWFVDKSEITKPGTYYGETFSVSETQIGYDPETVDDWFGADDKPDLTNAEPLCVFTYSFNYCGAQCCVNTTIDIKKEVCFQRYGGIQQQFFLDTVFEDDNYNAMIMIPKAAQQGSTEVDKPFHSGNTSAPSYLFYRDGSDLKDLNNPIDRQIGFLQSPNTGKYLIGMAAGLSLVSGDTVISKRIQNCLIGNTTYFYLGSVVPNLRNKFYIAAINPSRFEDNDFFFPANYFKEINYYVSYFNPADNVGQVYWYKDGSKYIIYAHCQSQQINLAINIPAIMEGRKLTIVEKTSDTDLLTDTVQNGRFFVNYNTNNANYIVLIAE